jgi:hypothetical protein
MGSILIYPECCERMTGYKAVSLAVTAEGQGSNQNHKI